MTHIEQLLHDAGESIIVYPNRLGTITIVRIKKDQFEPFQDFIEVSHDDQVIDISGPVTPEALDAGIAKLGRKARREGEYVGWDEKMRKYGLTQNED